MLRRAPQGLSTKLWGHFRVDGVTHPSAMLGVASGLRMMEELTTAPAGTSQITILMRAQQSHSHLRRCSRSASPQRKRLQSPSWSINQN